MPQSHVSTHTVKQSNSNSSRLDSARSALAKSAECLRAARAFKRGIAKLTRYVDAEDAFRLASNALDILNGAEEDAEAEKLRFSALDLRGSATAVAAELKKPIEVPGRSPQFAALIEGLRALYEMGQQENDTEQETIDAVRWILGDLVDELDTYSDHLAHGVPCVSLEVTNPSDLCVRLDYAFRNEEESIEKGESALQEARAGLAFAESTGRALRSAENCALCLNDVASVVSRLEPERDGLPPHLAERLDILQRESDELRTRIIEAQRAAELAMQSYLKGAR